MKNVRVIGLTILLLTLTSLDSSESMPLEKLCFSTEKIPVEIVLEPTTSQEKYFVTMYKSGKSICDKYGIDFDLMIAQAVVEQGWSIPDNYRIFNILANSSHPGELVYDHGVKQFRNYRIYNSLDSAITDYCKLLSSAKRYKDVVNANTFKTRVKFLEASGYAEDSDYGNKLISVNKRLSRLQKDLVIDRTISRTILVRK